MTNFITNDDDKDLKKRLVELVENSTEMKFLVGFWLCNILSVNSNAQEVAAIPIIVTESKDDNCKKLLNDKVISLIQLLKINPEYNFENEQMDIDIFVYKMYGLNTEDIHEFETWYARRYPNLAKIL